MYANSVFSSQNVLGFSSFFSSTVLSGAGGVCPNALLASASETAHASKDGHGRLIEALLSLLDGGFAVLTGPNANHVLERRQEHLAVADAAGLGGGGEEL